MVSSVHGSLWGLRTWGHHHRSPEILRIRSSLENPWDFPQGITAAPQLQQLSQTTALQSFSMAARTDGLTREERYTQIRSNNNETSNFLQCGMLSMLEFFQNKTRISEWSFSALFHQLEAKGLFFGYPIDGACKLTRKSELCCKLPGQSHCYRVQMGRRREFSK